MSDAFEYYNATTNNDKRRKLNVKKLLETKALRITYGGDGVGGYIKSEDPKSFAIVTLLNDRAKNSASKGWPDKPKSIPAATAAINAKPTKGGLVDDGKYRQIIASAMAVGLGEDQMFLDESDDDTVLG